MYHAYNVIKFLNNDDYANSTIIDDIRLTVSQYKNGTDNDAMIKFLAAFDAYNKRAALQCAQFAIILMTDGYPKEFKDLISYYNLPFRFSKNPQADKEVLKCMMGAEDIDLMGTILFLLQETNCAYLLYDQEFLTRLDAFINGRGITFENMSTSDKTSWHYRIPQDQNQIIYEYNMALANNNIQGTNKSVSNYGELMFNEYIRQVFADKQVIWVSRDVADGFGYEFVVYDNTVNRVSLYTVKSTTSEDYFYETSLNEQESRLCNETRNDPHTDYHIIRILLGDNIKMVDINDKAESANSLYQSANSYKVLRKANGILNKYLTIEN